MTVSTRPPNRGATLQFSTTFYDVDGEETQPASAFINLVYTNAAGEAQELEVEMTAGSAGIPWTALFDTRDVGPGVIFYSIHSMNVTDDIPFAVEDGQVSINANAANLVTF